MWCWKDAEYRERNKVLPKKPHRQNRKGLAQKRRKRIMKLTAYSNTRCLRKENKRAKKVTTPISRANLSSSMRTLGHHLEICINLVTSLFCLLVCCTAALAEVIFGNTVGEGRWLGKLQDIQEDKYTRTLSRTHWQAMHCLPFSAFINRRSLLVWV